MHLFTQLNSRALWFLSLSKSCCQEPTSFNGAGHTANTGATGAYRWPGVKVALWLSFIKHQLSLWRDYRAILPQSQHKYLTLSTSHYQNPCFFCSIASADHNFPEPDRTSPNDLFCPTNSTKRKDPSVTAWNNKESSISSCLRCWNQIMFDFFTWKMIENYISNYQNSWQIHLF